MNIKNSIIDQLEKEADEFSYTLNISLKSGESVYIDGITKGEKNGYLNFAKHSLDTMILEIDNSLWRIQAEDIEAISVKKYKTDIAKNFNWFFKLFFSKGHFSKKTYLFWSKIFVFAMIIAVLYSAVRSVLGGDIMTVIMDPELLQTILNDSIASVHQVFVAILLIQIILFGIDLALPTTEPYRRIKPYPEYAAETRISNSIVIILFYVFYQIFTIFVGKIV